MRFRISGPLCKHPKISPGKNRKRDRYAIDHSHAILALRQRDRRCVISFCSNTMKQLWSNSVMKKFPQWLVIVVLAAFVSCGKRETAEDRKAEIEREVQQRLAAEHAADAKQQLAQREADLVKREAALAARENTSVPSATPETGVSPVREEDQTNESAADEEQGDYETFYTRLEPYGGWIETTDYGYVWRPVVAERSQNWRPYTVGRWIYTDAGWTWWSQEPFGWATYHYGRWLQLRGIGWVWVPGNEWGPAWVSWRKSSDYVGWAPLPPEARFDRETGIHNWADNYYEIGPGHYVFVLTNDFGNQELQRALVSSDRNITIVNQTTNVTNITYNKTTIINQGPDFDEIRKRTRQPIQRLRLERQPRLAAQNPQAAVRGDAIEMPAPIIAPEQRMGSPRNVKQNIKQVAVDRGWSGIRDEQAALKIRAKMKSEATPPPNAPPRKFVKPSSPLTTRPAILSGRQPTEKAPPSRTPASETPRPGSKESSAGPMDRGSIKKPGPKPIQSAVPGTPAMTPDNGTPLPRTIRPGPTSGPNETQPVLSPSATKPVQQRVSPSSDQTPMPRNGVGAPPPETPPPASVPKMTPPDRTQANQERRENPRRRYPGNRPRTRPSPSPSP